VSYVDAVLNHRFGADRLETFAAVEVDNADRTKEITDKYDIKVRRVDVFSGASADLNQGWTGFDFPGRGDKVSAILHLTDAHIFMLG
jgi:alpha-amylase